MSENPRPASTPPTLASGEKDEDEEKIAAELEVQECLRVLNVTPELPHLLNDFYVFNLLLDVLSARPRRPCAEMLIIVTTCSSSRCHMSPCPWHWEPRDHIVLIGTHHHPGLTDHSQTDGP